MIIIKNRNHMFCLFDEDGQYYLTAVDYPNMTRVADDFSAFITALRDDK